MNPRLFTLLLILLLLPAWAGALERRKEQFSSESSYLLLPLPYSIPGIGEGWIGIAQAGNIGGTNVDFYALAITGDATGRIGALEDMHIIPKTLILDVSYQDIDRASVQRFDDRGMSSAKDAYTLYEVNDVKSSDGQLTLTLWDRRIELFAGKNMERASITVMRDAEGEVIREFDEPYISEGKTSWAGMLLDYTDDYQDPRVGVRMMAQQSKSPRSSAEQADFSVLNKSLSFYLPLGESSTWAFNLYTSDAQVIEEGETDEEAIKAELGMNCNGDATCEKAEADLVSQFQASRKYGTARPLGGDQRMRAYPGTRFVGAHSLYYATELRLTVSDSVTPFNFGLWKDVSTGIQVALFSERGAAGDDKSKLTQEMRTSSGVGLRMVTASGYVYRADVAAGDEGSNTTIIFDYPW